MLLLDLAVDDEDKKPTARFPFFYSIITVPSLKTRWKVVQA